MFQYINVEMSFRHLYGIIQMAVCMKVWHLYVMLNLEIINIYIHTFIYVIYSHKIGQLCKEKDYRLAAEMCDVLNKQLSNRFRRTNNKEKCPGTEENL